MRAAREEERQQRLKKAERMAGEMGVRAAEQEAELDQRIKKAQEEARYFQILCSLVHERNCSTTPVTDTHCCYSIQSQRPGKGSRKKG